MAKTRRKRGPLTGDQKRLIVQLLAEFCPPSEVVLRFKEATGRPIGISHVVYYRDTPRWRDEIEKARQALLANVGNLPIASKYWRLLQLGRLFDEADKARKVRSVRLGQKLVEGTGASHLAMDYERLEEKDFAACRELLRQAAEELGQLRAAPEEGPHDRPRVVVLGGRAVSPAVAGLPDPGPRE